MKSGQKIQREELRWKPQEFRLHGKHDNAKKIGRSMALAQCDKKILYEQSCYPRTITRRAILLLILLHAPHLVRLRSSYRCAARVVELCFEGVLRPNGLVLLPLRFFLTFSFFCILIDLFTPPAVFKSRLPCNLSARSSNCGPMLLAVARAVGLGLHGTAFSISPSYCQKGDNVLTSAGND